jgi:branched-chain amino acid transport system substrate-binding protein
MTRLDRLGRLAILFCTCLLPAAAHAEIFVGVAGPLTGQNAAFGNEIKTGVAAAIARINAAGGINGENLVAVDGDDGCDTRRAVDVAKNFASKDVRVVVGHFCSGASLAAAVVYEQAGIVMITPSATDPLLTAKSLWNVFRLTGRDDLQADVAAQRIKVGKIDGTPVLITDGQPATARLVQRFLNSLPKTQTITVKPGAATIPDPLALIGASSFYLALQPNDAVAVLKEIRAANQTAPVYGPDLLQSDVFATKPLEAANGLRVTFPVDWSTLADPKRLAEVPANEGAVLSAYAAVEVYAAAAQARSVNDNRAIANWLAAGNEVPTIVGPLRFNASGDLQKQPFVWYQWRDGVLSRDPTSN